MSKQPEISPELQTELNRALWIQALRENGHRQCIGWGIPGREVCALELLSEVTGIEPDKSHGWADQAYTPLYAAIGSNVIKGTRIWRDNDGSYNHSVYTFAQIADAAEQGRYWSD